MKNRIIRSMGLSFVISLVLIFLSFIPLVSQSIENGLGPENWFRLDQVPDVNCDKVLDDGTVLKCLSDSLYRPVILSDSLYYFIIIFAVVTVFCFIVLTVINLLKNKTNSGKN